jgi:predicted DNA-binding protein (MmcQ/YjbR family)
MNADSLRTFCLSLPHVTEDIKWGHDLCFLIAEKMFAVTGLDSAEEHGVAFKCTPEKFAELIEIEGIIPAPYMARNHWVSLRQQDALRDAEIKKLIRGSYELVLAKLPKRVQEGLKAAKKPTSNTTKKKRLKPKRSSSR